ncbi:MAG TPA: DUF2892 domain-containing protein [Candidatus Limnocylindria bacterium]|jgi:hypothetical protein|nr:DUF2892 domain-containing protein [Candidatus Limnocylindria bacterium]
MKSNLGTLDRSVRIALGLAIIVAGYFDPSAWAFLAAIPLITGLLGFCPIYCPLGLNTRRTS